MRAAGDTSIELHCIENYESSGVRREDYFELNWVESKSFLGALPDQSVKSISFRRDFLNVITDIKQTERLSLALFRLSSK